MKAGRRYARIVCGLTLGSMIAASAVAATAAPVALRFVTQSQTTGDMRVIDVRAEKACTQASLPGARCLPASELFDAEGAPVSFHVLRWLMGTIGLTGNEPVLIVADDAADAAAVGGLLLLAGQDKVAVLDGSAAIPAGAPGGNPRSMTREAVFTAPMRDRLLTMRHEVAGGNLIDSGRPYARLRAFARRYADGAPPTQLRLLP
jgi:hypothetical protein